MLTPHHPTQFSRSRSLEASISEKKFKLWDVDTKSYAPTSRIKMARISRSSHFFALPPPILPPLKTENRRLHHHYRLQIHLLSPFTIIGITLFLLWATALRSTMWGLYGGSIFFGGGHRRKASKPKKKPKDNWFGEWHVSFVVTQVMHNYIECSISCLECIDWY